MEMSKILLHQTLDSVTLEPPGLVSQNHNPQQKVLVSQLSGCETSRSDESLQYNFLHKVLSRTGFCLVFLITGLLSVFAFLHRWPYCQMRAVSALCIGMTQIFRKVFLLKFLSLPKPFSTPSFHFPISTQTTCVLQTVCPYYCDLFMYM